MELFFVKYTTPVNNCLSPGCWKTIFNLITSHIFKRRSKICGMFVMEPWGCWRYWIGLLDVIIFLLLGWDHSLYIILLDRASIDIHWDASAVSRWLDSLKINVRWISNLFRIKTRNRVTSLILHWLILYRLDRSLDALDLLLLWANQTFCL